MCIHTTPTKNITLTEVCLLKIALIETTLNQSLTVLLGIQFAKRVLQFPKILFIFLNFIKRSMRTEEVEEKVMKTSFWGKVAWFHRQQPNQSPILTVDFIMRCRKDKLSRLGRVKWDRETEVIHFTSHNNVSCG